MIKHLGPKTQQFLWKFVSNCIITTFIPDEWREAFVYPIPKPKEWECELTNTRPITLLETVRKLMVKILNHRLSNLFAQKHILKGYQLAGIPGSSTMEPIRILNELIEDAKEKKSVFCQAEDGIRDLTVTGVQTCALPICFLIGQHRDAIAASFSTVLRVDTTSDGWLNRTYLLDKTHHAYMSFKFPSDKPDYTVSEIGRASCRERV